MNHCATNRSGRLDRKLLLVLLLLHSIMKCLILGVLPKWDKLLKGSVAAVWLHIVVVVGATWHVADGMCLLVWHATTKPPGVYTRHSLQFSSSVCFPLSLSLCFLSSHRLNLLTFSAFIRISLAFSRYIRFGFRTRRRRGHEAKRQVGATSISLSLPARFTFALGQTSQAICQRS